MLHIPQTSLLLLADKQPYKKTITERKILSNFLEGGERERERERIISKQKKKKKNETE